MPASPLISPEALRQALADATPPLVLDCGFDLADTEAGARAYAAGHIPGALYAHLDRDLSGPKTGRNGRHPLPTREVFAATLGRWGVTPQRAVVVYDAHGLPYASRAWWMLRWMGHAAVQVLDGGLAAWQATGGPLSTASTPAQPAAPYPAGPSTMPTIGSDELLAGAATWMVVDARNAERYRGEIEPLDPVAGRIPGALNRFFKDNLGPDGRLLPPDRLRAAFDALGAPAGRIVHQCGSGVTACQNLLAMEVAGLAGSLLYPGSWSEWCSDPRRPVARG